MGSKIVGYKIKIGSNGKMKLDVRLEDGKSVYFDEEVDQSLSLFHIVMLLDSKWDVCLAGISEDKSDLSKTYFYTQQRKAPTVREALAFEYSRIKSMLSKSFNIARALV